MFTNFGGALKLIESAFSSKNDYPSNTIEANDSSEKPVQVNDSLYELYRPPGTPKMQVLFVHGLQLRDQPDIHLSTWLSADKSCRWPEAWLPKYFPDAHIFCVSYNGSITRECGQMSMRVLGENLVLDLMEAGIGQIPFCPVILVGHSFGGLVIKQLCYEAFHGLPQSQKAKAAYNRFLGNVRGIFYYATPHGGMPFAEQIAGNYGQFDDKLLSYLFPLSSKTARLNEDFNGICRVYDSWLLFGLLEDLPTALGKNKGMLVYEASGRTGGLHSVETVTGSDHFSICRPANEDSSSFTKLKGVLHQIIATTEKEKEYGPGIRVGQIFASTIELGRGSNGTVVYKGYLRETESRMVTVEPRPIAAKRLLFSHHKNAEEEIGILIRYPHENVVRYYTKEETDFFIYLALERCSFSLDELIKAQRPHMRLDVENPTQKELKLPSDAEAVEISTQKELRLRSEEDWKLWCQWDKKWRPTPILIKIIEGIISGLKHLHGKNIAHRDMKPHNVLIKREHEMMQAKIADMGLSKELDEAAVPLDKLTSHGNPSGSLGWQAPEKLIKERRCELTGEGYLAADIFSLGCVLYYCITGGEHPYGSEDKPWERETNIAKGDRVNMKVEHESMCPEATDLIESLLDDVPDKRLSAQDVLNHPFFWDANKRLEFFQRASDKLKDDKLGRPHIAADVDSRLSTVNCGSWTRDVDPNLQVGPGGPGKPYKYPITVCGLLRLIRNLKNHFHDHAVFQTILGSNPKGIDEYFTLRFPRLLIEVHHVIGHHYKTDTSFQEYYPESYIPKFP